MAKRRPVSNRTLCAGLKGPARDEIRKLAKLAVRQGWDVWQMGGNHIGFRSPGRGRLIFAPFSGRSPTVAKRLTMDLRRAGLDLPPGKGSLRRRAVPTVPEGVSVADDAVVLEHVGCNDRGVIAFFRDVQQTLLEGTACQAISVGVAGS
ncbi:MAG: hypothetical protein QOE83_339 [Actinomycetota bacterium]|jgi:hypothetical protein|nr:hypothetical protein [Actinomycetota bacterium]